jgi:PAS domain S-box-containing protein
MTSLFSPVARRPTWARYGLAIGVVAVGVTVREIFTPAIGSTALPFVTLFPAVAIAAWIGRLGPGLLSVALSAIAADWFFIEPRHSFWVDSIFGGLALLAFVFSALAIVAAIEAMHRVRERLVEEKEHSERSHRVLQVTLSSIGDGVVATDALGCVTFLNPEAERLTGWTAAEAKGRPLPEVFRIFNERTDELAENPVEKVLRTGKVVGLANHTVLAGRHGVRTPIDDSAAPIRQPDGSVSGVILVFRDVTEERKTQEAKARLAAIVEGSGEVMLTKNLQGIIQTWNASAERLFGYEAKEIIGKPVTTLFPPDRLREEEGILDRIRHGQPVERLETVRVAKGGRPIPVSVSISPLRSADGELIGASKIIHDITELVSAREALMEKNELLATTLASIGDAVIVTDPEGRVASLNAEAERLTKWTTAEAAGRPLPEIFRIINESTRAPVENPVEKVLRLGHVVGLANHTLLIARGGVETPIDDSAAPIRRSGGPILGVVLVFRDFTEQKKAETALREANEQLASRAVHLEKLVQQRTARLAEMIGDLESFSYSMVHDMRAPLRAMRGFAQVLAEDCAPISADAQNYVRRIQTAAQRMDQLIQDGLNYSRMMRADLPLTPIKVDDLIRGIIETYPSFQSPHASIEIEGAFPLVKGNEAALTQCVSNLLGNAVKFVAEGVTPQVRLWAELRDERVRVFFKDNGIGIPAVARDKIFEIFQRLDAKFEGTGIGLAIVKKASERMNGTVGVESAPGAGSTFWLELPAATNGNTTTAVAKE